MKTTPVGDRETEHDQRPALMGERGVQGNLQQQRGDAERRLDGDENEEQDAAAGMRGRRRLA